MTNKEAIMQLEIMATNLVGAACEANSEHIKKHILEQIEALDMSINALKETGWIQSKVRLPITNKYRTIFLATVTCDTWEKEKTLVVEWENTKVRGKNVSRWIWNDRLFPTEWKVVAWKPLPKPLRGKKND